MRSRLLLAAIITGVFLTAALMLRAVTSIPPRTEVQDRPVESLAAPLPDGLAIRKTHCEQCHSAAWFDRPEKSRTEWEATLTRMEAMGVRLSAAEKDALLDELAAASAP